VVDRPLVRRRTAVAGALGGAAVAVLATACDNGDDLVPPESGPSGSTAATSTSAPEQTADELLVDEVLGQLSAALLRQALGPILRAHRRHIEALEGELPGETAAATPPDAAAALGAVRGSERQLQASLVDAAGRAESGALARLLASMSASVTQHFSLLPPEVAP
jgi:hypothetical protein